MTDVYLGNILRMLMLGQQLSPTLLAREIGVSVPVVGKWLQGETYPTAAALAKILLRARDNQYQLAQAIAYSRYQKIGETVDAINPKPYNFQEVLSKLVADAAVSRSLNEEERSRLFGLFDDISRHPATVGFDSNAMEDPSSVSELIVLPTPMVVAVNDWRRVIEQINQNPNELYELNWQKFEDLIGHLLEKYGWEITPMGYTKDDGIDLIAARLVQPSVRFTMMVQCKRYHKNRMVGVSVVKDVWATKWERGFHHAMIATTSYFTKGAIDKADNWKFELRDHDSIVALCKEYGKLIQ